MVPTAWRECAADSFAALLPQVDHLVVVSTASPVAAPVDSRVSVVSAPPEQGRNISAWWNLGLDTAALLARASGAGEWNVIVVNDDCILGPGTVRTLGNEMRAADVSLAYPNCFDDRWTLHRNAGPVELGTRIAGWCFMLPGEDGVRADERMAWWYGDDDLDWRCRELKGAVSVPGLSVDHLHPGQLTAESAELTAQAGRDREVFQRIWAGLVPH